jgi:hypothetical protein
MAKSKLELIRETHLTNNCPECFNQDLNLKFYQKHLYSRLFHRTTSEISHELTCNTCKSRIYPVGWTPDIERSVEYFQKALEPAKARLEFRPLFFVLVLLGIALAGALAYLYLQGAIRV